MPNSTVTQPTLSWLLEETDPGVRYLVLKDKNLSPTTSKAELAAAREQAVTHGPIGTLLSKMKPEGYWAKAGAGYSPKYRSTVWSLIMLSQLGATIHDDPRIAKAVSYYLDQAMGVPGIISHNGPASGALDCLQGNMCTVLKLLGCTDPRLTQAYAWLAQSQTGEGVADRKTRDKKIFPRYYSAKSGPNFQCGANEHQPCAWGAVKVMLAFSKLAEEEKTPEIKQAIQLGVDFLLGIEPTTGAWPYPSYGKISSNWFKFGFPVFYITDLLQLLEAFVDLGMGDDPRLQKTIQLILDKRDDQGRWPLEYNYRGKTYYSDFGEMKQPNKWVTYRALKVLARLKAD